MYTSGSCCRRNCRGVNDKVTDLTEESVDSSPVEAGCEVFVSVNESEAGKVSRGLEGWRVAGITDKLRVVGWKNRAGDEVGSCWEVDNSRRSSG